MTRRCTCRRFAPQVLARPLGGMTTGGRLGQATGGNAVTQPPLAPSRLIDRAKAYLRALEVSWSAKLLVPFGSLSAGSNMTARFAVYLEFRGDRIARQHNYDCFDPF